MKTTTKLTLTGLAAILLTAGTSAFAGDSQVFVIDNHHGAATYVYLPAPAPTRTTVAVYAQGKAVGQTNTWAKQNQSGFREISTPHGTVSYFVPAE